MNSEDNLGLWDGHCPECKRKGSTQAMMLNRHDFFECTHCRLQLLVFRGVQAVILKFRGAGDFHSSQTSGTAVENGEMLCLQSTDDWPFVGNPLHIKKGES